MVVYTLFRNRNFILLLAIGVGLVLGDVTEWIRSLTLPALIVVMTLSTMQVRSQVFQKPRALLAAIGLAVVCSYLVLSLVMLLVAKVLITDPQLWQGFVIVAAMPPAIAVIPFTFMLRGNLSLSLMGTFGSYLVALVIVPLIGIIILGQSMIHPGQLLITLVQLIVIPFLLSRILLVAGAEEYIRKWRGTIINWCFFLITCTVIGLNRDSLMDMNILVPVAMVAFISVMVLGSVIRWIVRRLPVSRENGVSITLMSTIKESGLGATIALSLFHVRVSLPAAMVIIFSILFFVWLGVTDHRTESSQGST